MSQYRYFFIFDSCEISNFLFHECLNKIRTKLVILPNPYLLCDRLIPSQGDYHIQPFSQRNGIDALRMKQAFHIKKCEIDFPFKTIFTLQ